MRWLGRAIAFLLALAVVALLVAAVWNVAVQSTLLNAETFKAGLSDQHIYADVVPVAFPALVRLADARTPVIALDELIAAIGEDRWRAIANELAPPAWLQAQIEGGIDQVFAWINGDSEAVTHKVFDLNDLRTRLVGDTGQRVIDQIIQAAPSCTPEQIDQLRALQTGANVRLPICQPPEDLLTFSRSVLESGLSAIAEGLNERELSLAEVFDRNPDAPFIRIVPLGVQAYRELSGLFYLCPAGLLALIVVVTVRTLKGFGRWIGLPLLLGGLLAVMPLPFLSIGILSSVTDLMVQSSTDPDVHLLQARLVSGLLRSALGQLTGPVLVQVAILVVVGVILLVISTVLPSRKSVSVGRRSAPLSSVRRRTVTVPTPGGDADADPKTSITIE